LQFKKTLNKAACDVQQTAVRTNFHTQKNQTTLVFQMIRGTEGLWYEESMVRMVYTWYE